MKGECVTATRKNKELELEISTRNSFCHSIDNDNSGSSNNTIISLSSNSTFEKIDTNCFSPEDS